MAGASVTTTVPGRTPIIDNGPFDKRITSIPFMEANTWTSKDGWGSAPGPGAKLTRGFIITEQPIGGARYRCNFLYNPSVINLSHSIDANLATDPNSRNPNDVTAGHLLAPMQQALTFTLLFDRTYEMWDPSGLYGDAAVQVPLMGCAYDVLSLYKMTGIATPLSYDSSGNIQTDASSMTSAFQKGMFSGSPSGPMIQNPVYAVIGASLSYYGFITELDVQFTHFTQTMVPFRGQVGVTLTLLPTPQGGNRYAPIVGPRAANYGDPLSQSQKVGNSGKGGR